MLGDGDARAASLPPVQGAYALIAFTRSLASTALKILRHLVDVVSVSLLCFMVVAIAAQIVGRYVLNYSIAWAEESATFAQVWLVLLGVGIAMRNGQHVGIDIFVSRCPVAIQRLAKASSFVLGLWFLLVVIVGSFSLIAIGMIVKSPALQWPLAVPYLALPVGMAYFMLEFAIATLPEIWRPGQTPPTERGAAQ